MAKNKPTKEELNEKIQEAIDEGDKLVEPEVEETVEEPVEEEKKIVIPKEPEEEYVEEETKPEEEPQEELQVEEAEPSEEVKEQLKKKLSASARENQKIYAKNRVINTALAEAEDVTEPTEEELRNEYDDWDLMSTTERKLAKEATTNRRWIETIKKAKDQATKIEKWNDSVESFISDPKNLTDYPELEGKEDDFVEFATNDENNSVPFKLLVSAFLHDQSKKVVKHKGKMLETGTGGSSERQIPKSNKLPLEEARKLRENDYAKWREYVQKGLIATEI
jgi:hypothetical protein